MTKGRKIVGSTQEPEQTSVPSIYAIGDAIEGVPELMPVAYQELLDVLKMKQEVHLITCIGSLEGRIAYERSVKTLIEKLMSEQKIVLHQFSSFEADKQQDILKQMNHQFIPLPVKVVDAVQMVKLKMEQWSENLQGPRKLGAKSSISI